MAMREPAVAADQGQVLRRVEPPELFELLGVPRSAWDAPPATTEQIQAGLDAVAEHRSQFGGSTPEEIAETDALLDRLLGPRPSRP